MWSHEWSHIYKGLDVRLGANAITGMIWRQGLCATSSVLGSRSAALRPRCARSGHLPIFAPSFGSGFGCSSRGWMKSESRIGKSGSLGCLIFLVSEKSVGSDVGASEPRERRGPVPAVRVPAPKKLHWQSKHRKKILSAQVPFLACRGPRLNQDA